MSIKSEVRKFIKRDAVANIGSEGLLGDRIVFISPGAINQQPVSDNEVLVGHSPAETDQILAGLKISADNAANITQQLSEVAYKVNHGHGIIARLLGDSSLGNNLNSTMVNLKKGSAGLKDNMEAAKHNFLLKGYFKKKQKEEDKKKKETKEAEDKKKQEDDKDKTGKDGVDKTKG
jgi:phospholipid/cholesterol/gamma-HCH transport system substrate-binding protein